MLIKHITNYRPIFILPFFHKYIENWFSNAITHSSPLTIIHDYQFGFRPQRNTTKAILSLVEFITDGLEHRQFAAGIFFDLSKAFDALDHSILLRKFTKHVNRGTALPWFQSYLYLRCQHVSIDGLNSDHNYVKCGVPLGSILGPILFLIHVNDLPSFSSKFRLILYTDDTTLLCRGSNVDNIIEDITNELHKLISWLANKLHLNANKSTFIIFHPNHEQRTQDKHIVIDNTNVRQ